MYTSFIHFFIVHIYIYVYKLYIYIRKTMINYQEDGDKPPINNFFFSVASLSRRSQIHHAPRPDQTE